VIGVFSLGLFVILAAVLNKIYSFTDPFGSMWTYWYIRESSTALLVANLPFVWTFWRMMSGTKSTVVNTTAGSQLTTWTGGRKRGGTTNSGGAVLISRNGGSKSSAKEVEIDEATNMQMSGPLTLDEILSEPNPASLRGEPSPYTHPHMFFGGIRTSNARRSPAPRAATNDRGEQQLLGRDSDCESATQGTPASSVITHSLRRHQSAGSFL